MTAGVILLAVAAQFAVLDRYVRTDGPRGLSALSSVTGDRYYSVDDSGGWLYELSIPLDERGRVRACTTNRCVRLAGRTDLEGCAWDPLSRRVWVSDESDASVRQFDPETGAETAVAPVPPVYRREAVRNRSLEALAISPDGLKMYVANEDTLRCDGAVASTNRGGVVRIQEFARTDAGSAWTATRDFRYRTHPVLGGDWRGLSLSGVAALAVDTDGSLLVLEREFSRKGLPIPTFRAQLVRVCLPPADVGVRGGGKLVRRTLFRMETGFSNYEGLARGPVLTDGTRTWLLVSDAGGGAEASILVLGSLDRR